MAVGPSQGHLQAFEGEHPGFRADGVARQEATSPRARAPCRRSPATGVPTTTCRSWAATRPWRPACGRPSSMRLELVGSAAWSASAPPIWTRRSRLLRTAAASALRAVIAASPGAYRRSSRSLAEPRSVPHRGRSLRRRRRTRQTSIRTPAPCGRVETILVKPISRRERSSPTPGPCVRLPSCPGRCARPGWSRSGRTPARRSGRRCPSPRLRPG